MAPMKIVFLGGGNMATALIGGLVARQHPAANILVVEPRAEQRAALAGQFGVATAATLAADQSYDVLVLAVKPQVMRAVLAELPPLPAEACVLSVAAGVRAADLARWLGHAAVLRAMPNTPALIGAGISGVYAAPAVSAAQRAAAETILAAAGSVVWVDEETQLDAVTAISGSGPAYVFYFIEALEAAARQLGLPAATARQLSLHTFVGAARLALEDGSEPAELRARVTSKGGTTERGIAALEAAAVKAAIRAAAEAAAARAAALGDELGQA